MTVHLYLAPAGAGKTAWALHLAREAARDLRLTPRVVVPTQLQVRAWRRRLAAGGGTLGVRVGTFDALYTECLNASGEVFTELSDPIQYRLLRAVVDGMPLQHYAPLRDRPGFIQVLQRLVGELKSARILPDVFAQAVRGLGCGPRLSELAQVYSAYQERLQAQGWADRAGMAWLAVEALERRAPQVARDWPLLIVDGLDDLTEVQLALLKVLAGRVGELVLTLTGRVDGAPRPLVHHRFVQTARRVQEALQVQAEPLPVQQVQRAPALRHLEAGLYEGAPSPVDADVALELVEAPDRAGEVRAALRWLKARLLQDHMSLADVALLARDVTPYRPFVLQTAAEFGLPVRLIGGLPLASNPAIAALLDLLHLALPTSAHDPRPALPRRLVVEAWRCPYLDWSALPTPDAAQSVGIGPGDADALDAAARWGQVIGGLGQWEEALQRLAERAPRRGAEEERDLPASVPLGSDARRLLETFRRFVQRVTPPQTAGSYREFVGWLETLIGSDPEPGAAPGGFAPREEPTSLQVVARARQAVDAAGLDVAAPPRADGAALQALKDVLRGLVWAEEAVETGRLVDLARFLNDLEGAVQASSYRPPLDAQRQELLVADVVQARGTSFRAVAVLGLAEGEFPKSLDEDPFLRDADRLLLRNGFGLPLRPSTESAEAEFFYETLAHPRERLLLTRPRLADNGAEWQASPYWQEVLRWVHARPRVLVGEGAPAPAEVASWHELMESLVTHPGTGPLAEWARQQDPARCTALGTAARVVSLRRSFAEASPFDGDLTGLADEFGKVYGPGSPWSASRLEAYRGCPFRFFVAHVLRLQPREEPEEGLDVAQLGNLYHRILEQVYQAEGVNDRRNLEQLLAALDAIADRILTAAPRMEGFRETAWWQQTCVEIKDRLRRSLQALHSPEMLEDFIPSAFEQHFRKETELRVADGEDSFLLHGVIDRVDRAPDGRLRVIDYKSGGPYDFDDSAVVEGKKLQLPLYALAARDALHLGEPDDGFYWHVQHARPSPFTLRGFLNRQGQSALGVAVVKAWEAVRGVRAGEFHPSPPDTGCPGYCPAVGVCWHFRPRLGG